MSHILCPLIMNMLKIFYGSVTAPPQKSISYSYTLFPTS